MKFPNTLWVTIEGEGKDQFLVFTDGPDDAADVGYANKLARYDLVEEGLVRALVEFVPTKKGRAR